MVRSPRFRLGNSALLIHLFSENTHFYNDETVTLNKVLIIVIIYSAEFTEIKDEGSWANLN